MKRGWLTRWLFRWRPSLFALARVCAWCDGVIATGGLLAQQRVSHGICRSCSARVHADVLAARRERLFRDGPGVLFLIFCCGVGLTGIGCERAIVDDEVTTYRPQRHRAISVSYSDDPQVPHLEVTP